MSFFGPRRFSTVTKKKSFSEPDNSPPKQMQNRLMETRRPTGKYNTMNSQQSSLVSVPIRHNFSQATSVGSGSANELHHGAVDPASIPMPGPEEVDRQFDDLLMETAVPVGKHEILKMQPHDKKWLMIIAHNQTKKVEDPSNDMRSAVFWIKRIADRDNTGRPTLSVKDSLSMQSVFRTSHLDFLENFVSDPRAVPEMNKLTDYFTGLTKRTSEETQILGNLIESYRLLMNNGVGMGGVIAVDGSLKSIALAMDFLGGSDTLTEKVVLLLSVACWFDEDGRQKVMEAIRYVRVRHRELSCFQTIVYLFEHTSDMGFKSSLATFITTVCNTGPTIEERVKVRNYFVRLDILRIFEKVLAKVKMYESQNKDPEAADENVYSSIKSQYEVFVTMMRHDQKEIVHKLMHAADEDASHFDLSKLNETWRILQSQAMKADCEDLLLNVLQALYLVPSVNTIAAPIYESIIKYIFEATSIDRLLLGNEQKSITDPPDLNYSELGMLLKRKIEYDAKIEVFTEKEALVKRQQKLITIMQSRLSDISKGNIAAKDALNLQEDLVANNILPNLTSGNKKMPKQKGNANAASGGNSGSGNGGGGIGNGSGSNTNVDISLLAGLGFADTANEIQIMKDREEKLKKEIDELQKQVNLLSQGGKLQPGQVAVEKSNDDPTKDYKGKLDSTGLVPAGIAPGKEKKEVPVCPKPGMPGSLENAPIPQESKRKKAKGGVNQEGGLAALFAGRAGDLGAAPGKKTMKKGPAVVDNKVKEREALVKLGLKEKQAITPNVKMIQVFWNVISPEDLEGTVWPELSDQKVHLDTENLEVLFGRKATVKKNTITKTESVNPETVKLIDTGRRQTVGIGLRKVKLAPEVIKDAIISGDEDVLSPENLQVFIDTAPTMDELTLLKKYRDDGSDPSKLAEEEKYLFELSEIPSLDTRLKCIRTSYTFASDARRIYTNIVLIKKAVNELNKSQEFKEILEIILAVGNYMNGGTTRGSAWGYKLDILQSLITIKDNVNNGTLVHYLFILFENYYPHLCEFNLPACNQVVNLSFAEITQDMNGLAKQVADIKNEIKKKPFSAQDKFKAKMAPFEVKASKDVEGLQKELDKVRGEFHSLALKFAESGNEVQPSTFFPNVVALEQAIRKAQEEIVMVRETQGKRAQAEEKKVEQLQYKKIKKLFQRSTDDDGNIDMGLIEAFQKEFQGDSRVVVDRLIDKYKRNQEKTMRLNKKSKKAFSGVPRRKNKYLDG